MKRLNFINKIAASYLLLIIINITISLISYLELKSFFSVIILNILAVLIGGFALFYLIKITSKQLGNHPKDLFEIAETISKGDLNVEFLENDNEMCGVFRSLKKIVDSLKEKAALTEQIANGDLTNEVVIYSEKDILGKSLDRMTKMLNSTISEVYMSMDQVASGASHLSNSSNSLSQGASTQAASIEEISSSMTELASQTKTNADNASEANKLSASACNAAQNGVVQVKEMISAMGEISESSKEISKIMKAIDEIAFQTNLLSLNAAIEAARAGKHGKGFSVVAQEVRNLASRSGKAAQETANLIENAIQKIEKGAAIAGDTGRALDEINEDIKKVATIMTEIASASNEQALGIGQINQGISQIDSITNQNTANAEATSATAQQFSSHANNVKTLLSKFKLKEVKEVKKAKTVKIEEVKEVKKSKEFKKDYTPKKAAQNLIIEHKVKQQVKKLPAPTDLSDPEDIIPLDDNEFGKY
ncbi:MAG: methyl-accepting chemotaxis protein [Desulfobacterales bacterium]|nr:methyl-accepting chemotaxis protein [Desulfobacterales bacterium]MBF0397544.1 methyl-accepting chemotaxis protein [Desulfobacterales bacterium]